MTNTANHAATAANRDASPDRFRAPSSAPPDAKRHYAELARQAARAAGLQKAHILTLDLLIDRSNQIDWTDGWGD